MGIGVAQGPGGLEQVYTLAASDALPDAGSGGGGGIDGEFCDDSADRSRGWADGYAALRRDVTALANEKRNGHVGPLLRANVLLMRQTIAGFAQLCFELSEWGFEEVTFNQLGGNDRPEFYPAHRLLPEQADRFAEELPGLRAVLARRGLRLGGGEPYLRRIRASARDERLPVGDCKPGQQFLFINETGLVAPCSFSAFDYGVPLDQIASVEALCGLSARFAEGRRRRRLPACEDCHSTQIFEKFAA